MTVALSAGPTFTWGHSPRPGGRPRGQQSLRFYKGWRGGGLRLAAGLKRLTHPRRRRRPRRPGSMTSPKTPDKREWLQSARGFVCHFCTRYSQRANLGKTYVPTDIDEIPRRPSWESISRTKGLWVFSTGLLLIFKRGVFFLSLLFSL